MKGRKPIRSNGRVGTVTGKNASLNLSLNTQDAALSEIRNVYTIGPENATNAELARIAAILGVLNGTQSFLQQPLARRLYLGANTTASGPWHDLPLGIRYDGPLNDAQKRAVQHIISGASDKTMTVVQGPPGTGKTTVVAASVMSMSASPSFLTKHGVWLVAHSNIAVKKMAEKLVDVGFFNFKLLISHEFHFDW